MTLVLSLFAYGTFEGAVKAAQYMKKSDKIKRRLANGTSTSNPQGFDYLFSPLPSQQIESDLKSGNQAHATSPNSYQEQSALTGGKPCDNKMVDRSSVTAQQLVSSNPSSTQATVIATTNPPMHSQLFNNNRSNKSYTSSADSRNPTTTTHDNSGRHLSIADQYKLNAELRANYSFASIGLYESAGAIDDLPSSSDPRVSPEPGSRNRY